ncbi:hypothetical protein C8N32_11749 [Rhodovulum imhoffii]|uniref:Uncharacterized protein n=1 Tax=Rhodovulum imhoffii TaxID=365340 RepID=A0A2T5BPZ4_9RHOB|nr:hypothetical protein [Rhodovulum imhoffii]MBK5933034.1 hypothetical protein [Rhodovulum imhoffii]PTN01101.1 hypothetical protein C8N32_11749 [Rhodovulum imhoffii]
MTRRTRLFLEREGYRRRRLRDMARLLPVLGIVLFLLPLLHGRPEAGVIAYLFLAWAGLILLAGLLSRRLQEDPPAPPGESGP